MSTGIQWTDEVWNPVIGCTPVSPGCLNCYAATMANRMRAMPQAKDYHDRVTTVGYNGVPCGFRTVRIAEVKNGRAVFTGDVRCLEHKLGEPLSWKKPRRVFVNSMSDLFHESVPFEFIDRVFAVMALCPRHTFQVLTKRPERMAEYLLATGGKVNGKSLDREGHVGLAAMGITFEAQDAGLKHVGKGVQLHRDGELVKWPLPNVWLGTSCENQATADLRIPHLLACPAAVRFLSCEPLLGPIDLTRFLDLDPLRIGVPNAFVNRPDWVIVGGESGPNARMCDIEWVREIVKQCAGSGVPCFVKQLGAAPYSSVSCHPSMVHAAPNSRGWPLLDPKGGDPSEWPEDVRVRQMPVGAGVTA